MVFTKLKSWPIEEGRYTVGNKQSPVAICTEATVSGMDFDRKLICIWGKCVTENVGIEKIVKNIITNPYVRFLILCGKKSHGHDVSQTIISLVKNGVDNNFRVIGSTGSIPVLKHLTKAEVKRFRDQILTVNMQGVVDINQVMTKAQQCLAKNPGVFDGRPIKIEKLEDDMTKIKCLNAKISTDKFITDPKGSFKITIDKETEMILCRHYKPSFELDCQVVGRTAKEIRDTILREDLIGEYKQDLTHAAYLGEELTKAEICLRNGIDYVQDEEIIIKQSNNETMKQNSNLKSDEFGW